MTTFTTFAPTPLAPFQFQATFDGAVYNVSVTWNTFGQRWYVNIVDQNNNLIVSQALIGSPDPINLSLITWADGTATATTEIAHGFPIGWTVQLTIFGAAPTAYNGTLDVLITGPMTFTYALANDPGAITAPGSIVYNISMTGGYFSSTLVYRDSTNTFEVSP